MASATRIVLLVLLALVPRQALAADTPAVKRFVIPGGLLPNSVDPPHVDQFSNYFPSQMVYFPPLEADVEGKLQSHILSGFGYDESKGVITLEMGHWTYSDGTPVRAEDVTLAIKRLVLQRPLFPVVRFIDGLEEWRRRASPLRTNPRGIEISGSTIRIRLTQKVYHPLFRFNLTVFSVIPSRCINLLNGDLTCATPPSSGYYVRGPSNNKNWITFNRRADLPTPIASALPAQVIFDYDSKPLRELIDEPGYDSVVWGYDLNYTPAEHAQFGKDFRVDRLPAAWFTGFVLNPRIKPFDNQVCRQWFSASFREYFAKQDLGVITPSSSIFTKIIPGYKSQQQLGLGSVPPAAEKSCLEQLRSKPFVYAIRSQSTPPLVERALREMASHYRFALGDAVKAPSSHSGWPSYKRSDVAMQLTNSGFWPLDPVGDIQMLLTPNLHEDYMDISSDPEVQRLLKEISLALTPDLIKVNMERLNQYLYDQALFNVFSNQAYLYLSKKGHESHHGATFSVTFPYPWQVF